VASRGEDDRWRGHDRGPPTAPAGRSAPVDPRTTPLTQPRTRTHRPETQTAGARPRTVQHQHARGGLLRAAARGLGIVLLTVLPLAALGLGLVYVKLQYGSIPLHFMVEPIRNALRAELDGIEIGIGDAALFRNAAGGIELRLLNVSLASSKGDTAVRTDEALVGLDAAALLTGRVAASRIVLVAPRLALSREPGGNLALRHALIPPGQLPTGRPDDGLHPAGPVTVAEGNAAGPGAPVAARVNPGQWLGDLVKRARRGGDATSHLKAFGVRDAVLEIEDGRQSSIWTVPEFEIEIDHHKNRSVVRGQGRVAPGGETFSLGFLLEEAEKAQTLKLKTTFNGLRPRALARAIPQFAGLAGVDLALEGSGDIGLTSDGDVIDAALNVVFEGGRLAFGGETALGMEGGTLVARYDRSDRRIVVAPSTFRLEGAWVTVEAVAAPVFADGQAEPVGWKFQVAGRDGAVAGVGGAPGVPIEQLEVQGWISPVTGSTELQRIVFKAGGASVEATGSHSGSGTGTTALEGRIGPFDVAGLGRIWPTGLVPRLRAEVVDRLVGGRIAGGQFRLASGDPRGLDGSGRLTLSLTAEDIALATFAGAPHLTVPRALITVAGPRLELSVPDGQIAFAGNRRLALKGGQLVVTGLDQPVPELEVEGRMQGALSAVMELASHDAVGLIRPDQVPPGTEGRIDAQWRAVMPATGRPTLSDVRLDAKARVSDGRIPNVLGTHDVTGANFTLGVSERTIDVKGEMLLAGVVAKATGQWILSEGGERQAPLTISARLDGADRRQLGLDIEEFVDGEVPLEVQFTPGVGEHSKVSVSANLTGAALMLDGLAWRKDPGRPARLTFDVVRIKGSRSLELQGFRIAGESITVNGTIVIGPDGKAESYKFPGFSLNVVSNLEIEGMRRAGRGWEIKARGKTFDGAELLKSLYTVDQTAQVRRGKPDGTIEIDAMIDTVLGTNDATFKSVHLKLRKSGDSILGLELDGQLDSGQPITARMTSGGGQNRIVHVTTPDAGRALRAIGIYSNMLGGAGELWVYLDGRGTAERAGRIQVSRFRILGDPIVSELVQGADESRPAIATGTPRAQRRVVREEIQFETLRGSFATGNGQVAIESLNAAGPLIGASVRGKMDFRVGRLSLGGTYVPLSGLNRALAGIPLVGEILTGPRGDGIFGITFAVDGPMTRPNVIVNPLSIVAPGVLREIFQMVPDNPQVTPAREGPRPTGGGARVRSSEPEAARRPESGGAAAKSRTLDGWSSQTAPSKGGRN